MFDSERVADFIESCADGLWMPLMWVLLACGVYFTIRTSFVQFRMVGEMFRLLGDKPEKRDGKRPISSFEAFAVSVATRVGTGNLAGVATAIAIGGPGAVMWMWVIALIGSATAFVESTLAQLYKRREKESFVGGPAYYILHGMHSKWLSATFAVLITLTFGLSYNSIQSNTICGAMQQAFHFDPMYVGVVIVVLSLLIVFGGIHRIARVSSIIVPVMAIGYLLLALVVVAMNVKLLPDVMKLIFENAFGVGQVAGGAVGYTMRAAMTAGIKRGLFSNEAGEGSAPNAAATAHVSHPVKQGLIQSLGVFTDTLLVCSCTAFIILLSGIYTGSAEDGIEMTQNALSNAVGSSGTYFVAIAILFFAFSSIIGNYYYGETNIRFLTNRRWPIIVFRVLSGGVMVMFGAMAKLTLVWNIGDFFMGLLTLCNLVAIVYLGRYAFWLVKDYRRQKKAGIKEPVFRAGDLPAIERDLDAWKD